MPADELRPPARAARRGRIWAAVGTTAFAVVSAVFLVVTLAAVIRNCDEDPECERPGPYPGLLVAIPPVSAWYGLVVLPRDARLLGKPGRRHELRAVFAQRREREWILFWPRRRVVTRAWLVATAPSGEEVAIPVSEYDGRRCRPSTAALVRGELRPGRHVVLDFPSEVIWPTGRVARPPDDARPLDETVPN